jgi:tetratricopeptide (TPR) repeat protein
MTYKKYSTALFAALLAALVLAVYWQTTGFEFIALDDQEYANNPIVKGGLTFSGIKDAFTSTHLHAYIPVTLLSFMADVELFGLKSSGFHFTNTLLHLLNTLLLFAFLYRATGSYWKSFFAAALWAVHPLRAESVAWVAERKDVLAGFFFLAGLLVYCEYAKNKKPLFYAAVFLAMLFGLASKSILVVFPFVLLITDFLLLERKETAKKILVEKIPFFALSVLFSVFSLTTLLSQSKAVRTLEQRGILDRIADVATSYLHYVKATFWPFGLFMENRSSEPSFTGPWALGAGILLIALTYLIWRFRKTEPSITAGWAWYLFVLFPVSGVLPLDFYFLADHFTYLPHIGLVIALVWGAERLYRRFMKDTRALAAFGGVIVIAFSVLCFRQVSLWKNDYAFFGHIDSMSCGRSALAKNGLAVASYRLGNYQEAYDYLGMVLSIEPNYTRAKGLKGLAAARLGKYREAELLLRMQLQATPNDKRFNIMLANILAQAGDVPGSARQGLENIRRWPGDREAWDAVNRLGGEARAREIAGR